MGGAEDAGREGLLLGPPRQHACVGAPERSRAEVDRPGPPDSLSVLSGSLRPDFSGLRHWDSRFSEWPPALSFSHEEAQTLCRAFQESTKAHDINLWTLATFAAPDPGSLVPGVGGLLNPTMTHRWDNHLCLTTNLSRNGTLHDVFRFWNLQWKPVSTSRKAAKLVTCNPLTTIPQV